MEGEAKLTKMKIPILADGKFLNGPIGGFTFSSGEKAKIYSCGNCGVLLKFNTGYNKHMKEVHGATDNVMFGWADGEPDWQELDITEDMIIQ